MKKIFRLRHNSEIQSDKESIQKTIIDEKNIGLLTNFKKRQIK